MHSADMFGVAALAGVMLFLLGLVGVAAYNRSSGWPVLIVGVVAIVGGCVGVGTADVGHRDHAHRVCFPVRKWTPPADAAKRPCAVIRRVEEDGSVVLAVLDADGTVRWREGIGAMDR